MRLLAWSEASSANPKIDTISIKQLSNCFRGFHPVLSPDETRIATCTHEKMVYIWDAKTGDELLALRYPARVTAIAWSPDGTKLLVGTSDGMIEVRDAGGPPPKK
jgi:WD40 repeat protein